MMMGLATHRVSPFGHPRITGCVRLPLAFRSLPRPSSPLYTQASPVRFRSLDYKNVAKQSTRIDLNTSDNNRSKTLNEIIKSRIGFVKSHDLPLHPLSNSDSAFRPSAVVLGNSDSKRDAASRIAFGVL